MNKRNNQLGICQWFHYQDYQAVENTVTLLRQLGVRHLRTGISWADFHRPEGKAWYDWQMQQLQDFEVLLSIWHTPPSLAEGNECAGPPRRLEDYADFIGQIISEYGQLFEHLELWNEPNNRYKWDFPRYDPRWAKFGRMVAMAGQVAQQLNKPTVLGGMIPVDHHWLNLMRRYGVLESIDVVAIHGFPGMWWPDRPNWDWYHTWQGWDAKVQYLQEHTDKPIWITETGRATWDFEHAREGLYEQQVHALRAAARAPAERIYWYSLIDLDPHRDAIEGFHVDENEYHLGLVDWHLQPKPAFEEMKRLMSRQRLLAARSS